MEGTASIMGSKPRFPFETVMAGLPLAAVKLLRLLKRRPFETRCCLVPPGEKPEG